MWLSDSVRRRGGVVVLLAALAIGPTSSCGFHLQGPVTLPEAMDVTYIQPSDRFSPVVQGLTKALEASGARVAPSPDEATARLILHEDISGQRLLSVSPQNEPLEYEVYYRVRYEVVIIGQGSLLDPQWISLTQDYTYDIRDVLGKAREREYLRQALADEIVSTIVRRLASLQ